MVVHKRFKNKTNANIFAKRMRRKGYICDVYKTGLGYSVSVRR